MRVSATVGECTINNNDMHYIAIVHLRIECNYECLIGITEFLCNAAREAKRNGNASALVFSFFCVMTTHQVPEGLRQLPS